MNPRFVGFAALLGALFFLFSMNSRGPTHTEQLSSQLFGEIRSIQARWGSGGEATVLKQQVAELLGRLQDVSTRAASKEAEISLSASDEQTKLQAKLSAQEQKLSLSAQEHQVGTIFLDFFENSKNKSIFFPESST